MFAKDLKRTLQLTDPINVWVDVPQHIIDIPAALRRQRRAHAAAANRVQIGALRNAPAVVTDEVKGHRDAVVGQTHTRRCLDYGGGEDLQTKSMEDSRKRWYFNRPSREHAILAGVVAAVLTGGAVASMLI